jgi:hypothetical protein
VYKPTFVLLNPQAICVHLPDIAGSPAHSGKELDAFQMIQKDRLKLRTSAPGNTRGVAHSPPVEASLNDRPSVGRGRRVSKGADAKGSADFINGPQPLLNEVWRYHGVTS